MQACVLASELAFYLAWRLGIAVDFSEYLQNKYTCHNMSACECFNLPNHDIQMFEFSSGLAHSDCVQH